MERWGLIARKSTLAQLLSSSASKPESRHAHQIMTPQGSSDTDSRLVT